MEGTAVEKMAQKKKHCSRRVQNQRRICLGRLWRYFYIGATNPAGCEKCLQHGTDWAFKRSGLRFVALYRKWSEHTHRCVWLCIPRINDLFKKTRLFLGEASVG
jgi:hypothetical protein